MFIICLGLGFAYSLVLCFVMIETGSGDSSNVQTHEDYRYLPSRRAGTTIKSHHIFLLIEN